MIDIFPLSVSQLLPYFSVTLLFCIGKNSWITQRSYADNWFFSVCWLNWKTFNNFLLGRICFLLQFRRVIVIFLVCSLKQPFTQKSFFNNNKTLQKSWTKYYNFILSHLRFFTWFQKPHNWFAQPKHPFLTEHFFFLWNCTCKGCWGWVTVIEENLTVATGFLSHGKVLTFAARLLSVRTRSIPPREVLTTRPLV